MGSFLCFVTRTRTDYHSQCLNPTIRKRLKPKLLVDHPRKPNNRKMLESPRPRKRKSRKLPRLRKTRRNPSTIRNCMSTTAYSTKRVDYYSFFCMFHPHTLKEVDHFSFLKNPHHAQNSKLKMF